MRSEFSPDMIIWSADVPKEDIARVIEARAIPEGTVIKLDRLFFEDNDKEFIHFCENKGYPVFADAKIIEIPAKSLAIAKTYLQFCPFMLNIMAGAANTGLSDAADENQIDALKRFADLCHESTTRSCVVTVLTSKSESLVEREFGKSPISQVLSYVALAHEADITDIVCSPKEVKAIRENPKFNNMWLNTPGVRPKGSNKDDQQRVSTPGQAIKDGANRVVIGRPLIAGEGPIEERVARNYVPIRDEILDAIAEMNA